MKIGKTIKNVLCISAMSLALATVVVQKLPIQDNAAAVEAATKKVKLSTTRTYLIKGKTKKLKLANANGKIKWSSNKKSIASVNSKGIVRGRKAGTAVITAKYNNKSYKCRVIVEAPKISKTKVTIQKGKTTKLSLKNTKQKVEWSTGNKKIATVTNRGVVKGVKAGKVAIYAKVGTSKYKCVVTVKNPSTTTNPAPTPEQPIVQQVEKITLNQEVLSVNVGGTVQLTATVYPADAENKSLAWNSSNPGVAQVDANGLVTGISEGTATITAQSNNGITGSCAITIIDLLNNSYEALQNFILNTGKVGYTGNHLITNKESIDGANYTWNITYEADSGQFNFTFGSTTSEESTIGMHIDARKSDYVTPKIYSWSLEVASEYKSEAIIPISSYAGQDIDFTITNATGFDDVSMNDTIQKSSNNILQTAMTGWQNMLKTQVGISFSDLGFTAYK